MRRKELTIDEDYKLGVDAISVVHDPAIEELFVALSKEPTEIKLSEVSKEKRILLGAVLVPNKDIPRRDKEGLYNIFLSEESVERIAEGYHINKNSDKSTLEHGIELSGLHVVQSWIVEDPTMDKSNLHGMNLSKGTWVVAMKVLNDEIWDEYVKTGKVRGFSIEAILREVESASKEEVQESEEDRLIREIKELTDKIMNQ